jgi:raffinose/stachyose/melibiose transport system substrate-binding protein
MIDTTLSRRKALQIGAAAAGLTLLPSRRRAAAQAQTVTFWNISGIYEVEDPNDKTKKPEDFYVYQAIARFEKANPGIKIEMEALPGDTSSFTKYRTASVAANGPDIMTMWSGSYMLAQEDFLELLTPYFTEEERARILGWEATSTDFKADSTEIYGVPASSDGCSCIFYNTELLDKAKLDPEGAWRASVDGFIGALEQMKTAGIKPLVMDQNSIIWQLLVWWIAQELGGSAVVSELVSGKRNFSDPPLPDIVASWQKLNDYALPGAETTPGDTSFRLMLPGDVAMTTAGFWGIAPLREGLGDKLGMVKMPNYSPDAPIQDGGIGGVGNAFMVSNYSAAKDQAVAFIKFLMSKEEQELKAKSGQGRLINVTDVDTTKLYSDPLTNTQQQWATEPSTIFWLDNLFPADLTNELKAQSQLAWTSGMSADEFLAKADAKRDELLGG